MRYCNNITVTCTKWPNELPRRDSITKAFISRFTEPMFDPKTEIELRIVSHYLMNPTATSDSLSC